MDSRPVPVLVGLLLVASLVPPAIAAGYEISASDTTSVPERTVDLEGQSFTIDSMIRASRGDSASLDVRAPDERYELYLYDSDRSIVASERGEGDESFSFDLTGYEPGTYVVTTYHDGNYEAIQPVLVSGYDVSADAPSSVSSGESVDVTLDVSATAASSDPANVTVIVARGGTTHEVEASGSDGEYTATVDSGELDAGEYTVYGVVQSDEEAFGHEELVGLSDGQSLTVEADSSSDDSGSASDSNDSESADDPDTAGAEADSTATETDSTDDSSAANAPANESTNQTATTTATESSMETATESPTETATETDDGVITPGENESETESTGASGAGFTVVGTVAAITLVALLGRRRF